jgi:uncharacterized protein
VHFDTDEQALQADLLWAITSPDLMLPSSNPNTEGLTSIADAAVFESLSNWLQNNDHQQALAKLIQQRQPRRLGIYYEVLWQYVLEHFPGFSLTARNLPIMRDGRTLGELDFIYYCQHRQRYIHLETAVKFYLGVPDTPCQDNEQQPALPWSHWFGPGCKDRLDLKLLKMLNQQTRLATTIEGSTTLKILGVDAPLREICLKGYFFYPLHKACPPPFDSHPHHARGHWLKISEMDLLPQHTDCWQIMKKKEWLAPLSSNDDRQLLKLSELTPQTGLLLASNPFPIMIANMQATGGSYREASRFFITPDHWPNY